MIGIHPGIIVSRRNIVIPPTPPSNPLKTVGTGEYVVAYVDQDDKVWAVTGNNNAGYLLKEVGGVSGTVLDADGGQYHASVLSTAGAYTIHINNVNSTVSSTHYPLDNLGNSFLPSKIIGFGRCMIGIQNGEVYYWSVQDNHDILNQFGGSVNTIPRKLVQPPGGRTIVQLACGANYPTSYSILFALASDGTVWRWSSSNTIPVQVTGGWTGDVIKIAAMGIKATVLETSTGQLWGWGLYGSHIGAQDSWQNPNPQNITSTWSSATFPLKELVGGYNTVHIIDANDNMFVAGQNVQGQFGNGVQWSSWRTHTPDPYMWGFDNTQLVGGPIQIRGKWKNIKCNTTVVFYNWAQDLNDNWYSWGRNKARCLGNGLTMRVEDESIYSEYYNNPAPIKQAPLTQLWTIAPSVNVNANREPVVNVGQDQKLSSGTTSTTLYGDYSSQQQPTSGGITVTMSYAWTLVSGPNTPTIVSPTSANTNVTGMIDGEYVFRLTVTNSNGLNDNATVTIKIE